MAASEMKIPLEEAKEAVTRRKNSLLRIIQEEVKDSLLLEHKGSLIKSYTELEKTFDNMESQEDAKYLNQPYQEVMEGLLMCREFLKRRNELREAFEAQGAYF